MHADYKHVDARSQICDRLAEVIEVSGRPVIVLRRSQTQKKGKPSPEAVAPYC